MFQAFESTLTSQIIKLGKQEDKPQPTLSKDNQSEEKNDSNELSELIKLMKTLVRQNSEALSSKNLKNYQIEPRNKGILVPLPTLSKKDSKSKQLKQWIAEVASTVFSSAFYYFSKAEMSFRQAKVFCSQNILKNISALNQDSPLGPEQFQILDKHLTENVLPYLDNKYPFTDSSEINKKLESMVEEIDNLEEMQNNYFNNSKVYFEYREDGNYNDVIMKVVNDLLERIDILNPSERTNYQEFDYLMSTLFNKVYNYEWMREDPNKNFCSRYQKPKEEDLQLVKDIALKRQQQEKYKNTVKEYTSFLIGRKIPENVPLFTNEEISQNKINIKHPAILRILTKWFEELWKKFQKNYFSNSSESFKLQKGDQVHELKPQYKVLLDTIMEQEKKQMDQYIIQIQKLNYKLESYLMDIQPQLEGQDQMNEEERICGKFAYKIVKNLHKEIIQYLNKAIHSLLSAAKKFHQHILHPNNKNQVQKANWPYPPNLISFKVGDLIRCKLHSKEKEIIRIYQQLLRMSQLKQNQKTFKIIRVKNRLKSTTNDLLINVRFKQNILCEIQLAIKSKASDFTKASNSFHHYIYELQRSQFGPLTELCSIWMSLDDRAHTYQRLIQQEDKSKIQVKTKFGCNCVKYLGQIKIKQSFICDKCTHIRMHNNYILKHLECQNCRNYFICAKCRINQENFELLKNKLTFTKKGDKENAACNKLLRENCLELINEEWFDQEGERNRYGVAFFIQSSKNKAELFKLVVYNNQKYLLGRKENDEFFEVANISDRNVLRQFCSRNILMQVKEHPDLLQFDDIIAIKEYILPQLAKINYKKYKENVALHLKSQSENNGLNNQDCKRILMTGLKPQREKVKNLFASDNQLTKLPITYQDFPNLEWLVLSRNPIESLKGIEQFTNLKTLVMENEHFKNNRLPAMLTKFSLSPRLEKLVLTNILLGDFTKEFTRLKNIKVLFLENCQLRNIQPLSQCQSLQNLNLSSNLITTIPTDFSQLPKLEVLILQKNPTLNLIESTKYPSLTNTPEIALTLLDLSYCGIKQIPEHYSNLTNLQIFQLQGNKLTSIPLNLFQSMHKLQVLNLSGNPLTTMPDLSACLKLNKLYLINTKIQELPAYLSDLSLTTLSFQGCPIKKIECLMWLNDNLYQNSTVIQTYNFWLQKIPSLKQLACNNKHRTIIINNDQIQSEQSILSYTSRDLEKSTSLKKDQTQEKDQEQKQNQKEQLQKITQDVEEEILRALEDDATQSSINPNHFLDNAKKIVSYALNNSEDEESDTETNMYQQRPEQEAPEPQFQEKFQDKINKEVITHYFPKEQMFVFDFQHRIRYHDNNIFYYNEINLYHDEQDKDLPLTFQNMLADKNIECAKLNIYVGNFSKQLKPLKPTNQQLDNTKPIVYYKLKRDKLPYTYTATLDFPHSKLEIVNSNLQQTALGLFKLPQLQELKVTKAISMPPNINQCINLKKLKMRQSQLDTLKGNIQLLHLEKLDLKGNNISLIEQTFFSQMPALKSLTLSKNNLKEVPPLFACQHLQYLDLQRNNISSLPENMKELNSLTCLTLDQCPLETIHCKQWLAKTKCKGDDIRRHRSQFLLWKEHNLNETKQSSILTYEQLNYWSLEMNQDHKSKLKPVPYSQPQQDNYNKLYEVVFNQKNLLKSVQPDEFLALNVVQENFYSSNNDCQIRMSNSFQVIIDRSYPQTQDKIVKILKQNHLEEIPRTVIRLGFREIPEVLEPECYLCKKPLTPSYYWLLWEKHTIEEWHKWEDHPRFGCRKCVEAKDKKGVYKYKNNSILLTTHVHTTKILSERLGKNLQPKKLSGLEQHKVMCSSCEGSGDIFKVGMARYICVGCTNKYSQEKINTDGFVDLCESCMNKYLQNDENVVQALAKQNHQPWHSFLRVLYNTKGYYVF